MTWDSLSQRNPESKKYVGVYHLAHRSPFILLLPHLSTPRALVQPNQSGSQNSLDFILIAVQPNQSGSQYSLDFILIAIASLSSAMTK